ncbi:hypothetical protein B0H13DRAFT_2342221 [Mycena leptocephala]|nr:hypothetical protein B0H13DRAFT_2342221 [Mycena leptocephala]
MAGEAPDPMRFYSSVGGLRRGGRRKRIRRTKPSSSAFLIALQLHQCTLSSYIAAVARGVMLYRHKVAYFAATRHIPDAIPTTTPPKPNQCCASVQSSSNSAGSSLLSLLGIVLNGLDIPIGLSCSPITVVGNNWQRRYHRHLRSPRSGVDFSLGGLIAINCIPITV